MKIFIFILLTLSFYSISFAQTKNDYKALNMLLKVYPKVRMDKLHFLTFLNPSTKNLESESPKEHHEEYALSMNEMIKKNIPESKFIVTRKMVRKSYVKWDKKKIELSNFTNTETKDPFYYYTKPIFVNNDHFIIIDYYIMPAGGIGIKLFKLDETNNQVVKIDGETLLLYGLNFR